MKRGGWIIIDVLLAAIIAILGDAVSANLIDKLSLTDPLRFLIVAGLFVVCLVTSILITVRRLPPERLSNEKNPEPPAIHVVQEVEKIGRNAVVTGAELQNHPAASVNVQQTAAGVEGQLTGITIQGRPVNEKPGRSNDKNGIAKRDE